MLYSCVLGALMLLASVQEALALKELEMVETNPNSPFGTKYSDWGHRVNYTSSTQFQVRGMEPFYNVTNMILKWFEPEPTIPEGMYTKRELCRGFPAFHIFLHLSFVAVGAENTESRPSVRFCLHNFQLA